MPNAQCPISDISRKTTARSNVYVSMKNQDSGWGKAHQKPEIIPQIGRRIVDCEIHTSKLKKNSEVRIQYQDAALDYSLTLRYPFFRSEYPTEF
jgi:hypothetical protein